MEKVKQNCSIIMNLIKILLLSAVCGMTTVSANSPFLFKKGKAEHVNVAWLLNSQKKKELPAATVFNLVPPQTKNNSVRVYITEYDKKNGKMLRTWTLLGLRKEGKWLLIASKELQPVILNSKMLMIYE